MAIYHFSGTIISRSQGRSVVAAAAYRSGEKLVDLRQDRTHDYTKKQDIAHSEILLPEKAPEWMANRELLWNQVEQTEKRKDAQLAREFTISLPRELTIEQNTVLIREFVQKEFVDKGMIADISIHNDRMDNGERQPHAHVMLTMREVTAEGFGQKVRSWNAKENLLLWREEWANTVNRHLGLHGHDLRIDHRSFKEQGIELEPQHKIGAAVAKEHMARLEDHQRIARENGQRIYDDPNLALNTLTRQQSTFTHHELARFINRHSEEAEQFAQVFNKVKASPELVSLGVDKNGHERFTTGEMLAIESRMMAGADSLLHTEGHPITDKTQSEVLAKYASLTWEQKTAFAHLVEAGNLKCVVGYAGTGKSYMLGAAREAWEAQGYRVHGATLSGIAAESLEASSGIESRTLASRLYYWDKGEQRLTGHDILVIDEAGMIGSRQMERIITEAERAQAKVILIGDPQQLQAIDAGAAFRAISERSGYVELTDIRRQQSAWQKAATRELAAGNVESALSRYEQQNHLHEFETKAEAKQRLVDVWNDARLSEPDKTQIILAYTRNDVRELNSMARQLRQESGELGPNHLIQTERGERHFAVNDRVYFLKNERALGVKNGTLGTIEKLDGQWLQIRLDKAEGTTAKTIQVDINRYNHLDHGYAATIHKTQSITVDRSYVLASRQMDSHAAYVGFSRHKESTDIFYSRDEFSHQRALAEQLGRDRAKDVTLDYQPTSGQREPALSGLAQGTKADREVIAQRLRREIKAYKERTHGEITPAGKNQDLEAFRKAFEAKNADMAQQIRQEMQREPSSLDKRMLEVERQLKQLEFQAEKSNHSKVSRQQLEKYAATVGKEKDIMQHIRQQNPDIGHRLEKLQLAFEKNQERGRER